LKDYERIAELLSYLSSAPERAALATLVGVQGSSYRRPGARLLVTASGKTAGGISAGCLEADVILRAHRVLQSGKPVCVTYDAVADSDLLLGLGMGCGGTLRIVIEPLAALTPGPKSPQPLSLSGRGVSNTRKFQNADALTPAPSPSEGRGVSNCSGETKRQGDPGTVAREDRKSAIADSLADWLAACALPRDAAVAAAVVHDGSHGFIGTRAWLFADGRFAHDVEEGDLARALEADLRIAARERQSFAREYATAGRGVLHALIDVVEPATHLLICGSGDDALPLYRMARELGWRVTVVDIRGAFATRERFSEATVSCLGSYDQILDSVTVTPDTAVVIMTHNYNHDRDLLRRLLPSDAAYIGLLGARHRSAKLLEDLRAEGDLDDAADIGALHTPAGLDIGATTPEAIALSIVAEIQACVSRHEQVTAG
jgi:xanthine dehydrogenase accessory factor